MTEDEIILIAQQAHFNSKTWIDIYNEGITTGDVRGYLQAFAHLVAAKALKEHAMRQVQRLGQEIEQEPVAWITLQKEAQQIVESKVLWKKFIDGTPLVNDIACWMADFALQHTHPPQRTEQNFCPRCGKRTNDIHTCTPPQRTEQEPVQVSPLEFVEMVMEKEHLIGKPIFWAEWPNKEKNT
jgi:hypothetical protein